MALQTDDAPRELLEQLQRERDLRGRIESELRSSLSRESALQDEVQRLMSQEASAAAAEGSPSQEIADSALKQQTQAMTQQLEQLAADKMATEAEADELREQLQVG